jgi:cytochrome c peroxidase
LTSIVSAPSLPPAADRLERGRQDGEARGGPERRAAIAQYASGDKESPLRSSRVRGFALSDRETDDLMAFLESLTDRAFLSNPAFADPAAPRSAASGTP